jgi:hypothetical protein
MKGWRRQACKLDVALSGEVKAVVVLSLVIWDMAP